MFPNKKGKHSSGASFYDNLRKSKIRQEVASYYGFSSYTDMPTQTQNVVNFFLNKKEVSLNEKIAKISALLTKRETDCLQFLKSFYESEQRKSDKTPRKNAPLFVTSFETIKEAEQASPESLFLTDTQKKAVDDYFNHKIFYGFTREGAVDLFVWHNTLKEKKGRTEEQEMMLQDSATRLRMLFNYEEDLLINPTLP